MINLPIIVQPTAGLCNRMRTIAAASVLAERLGRKMIVVWTSDATLNASFRSLFKPLPFKVIDVRLQSFFQRFIWHFCTKILRYKIYDDKWIYDNARGKDFSTWRHLIEGKRIYMHASSDIFISQGDYSIFKVTEEIKRHTLHSSGDCIGIHIRRTDNEMSVRYSPTELFIRKIEEEIKGNPAQQFYLATDDKTEEEHLLQMFPDNITVYEKQSLDRNDPIAIRDAVIDLYNLAHCKKIYGSYYSSFSDIAALWGGIEKEVLKTNCSQKQQ